MLGYFRLQKSTLLAAALFSVVLGILIIAVHERNLPRMLIFVLAAACAVFGVLRMVRWLTGRGDAAQGVSAQGPRVRIDFWAGAVLCVAAVIMAVFSRPLGYLLSFILGAYVLADGLFSLANAIRLKKLQFGQWKTVMALAIVPVVLGLLMIVLPNVLPGGDSCDMLRSTVMGAGLIVNGGINLWSVYCLHKGGAVIIEKKK